MDKFEVGMNPSDKNTENKLYGWFNVEHIKLLTENRESSLLYIRGTGLSLLHIKKED